MGDPSPSSSPSCLTSQESQDQDDEFEFGDIGSNTENADEDSDETDSDEEVHDFTSDEESLPDTTEDEESEPEINSEDEEIQVSGPDAFHLLRVDGESSANFLGSAVSGLFNLEELDDYESASTPSSSATPSLFTESLISQASIFRSLTDTLKKRAKIKLASNVQEFLESDRPWRPWKADLVQIQNAENGHQLLQFMSDKVRIGEQSDELLKTYKQLYSKRIDNLARSRRASTESCASNSSSSSTTSAQKKESQNLHKKVLDKNMRLRFVDAAKAKSALKKQSIDGETEPLKPLIQPNFHELEALNDLSELSEEKRPEPGDLVLGFDQEEDWHIANDILEEVNEKELINKVKEKMHNLVEVNDVTLPKIIRKFEEQNREWAKTRTCPHSRRCSKCSGSVLSLVEKNSLTELHLNKCIKCLMEKDTNKRDIITINQQTRDHGHTAPEESSESGDDDSDTDNGVQDFAYEAGQTTLADDLELSDSESIAGADAPDTPSQVSDGAGTSESEPVAGSSGNQNTVGSCPEEALQELGSFFNEMPFEYYDKEKAEEETRRYLDETDAEPPLNLKDHPGARRVTEHLIAPEYEQSFAETNDLGNRNYTQLFHATNPSLATSETTLSSEDRGNGLANLPKVIPWNSTDLYLNDFSRIATPNPGMCSRVDDCIISEGIIWKSDFIEENLVSIWQKTMDSTFTPEVIIEITLFESQLLAPTDRTIDVYDMDFFKAVFNWEENKYKPDLLNVVSKLSSEIVDVNSELKAMQRLCGTYSLEAVKMRKNQASGSNTQGTRSGSEFGDFLLSTTDEEVKSLESIQELYHMKSDLDNFLWTLRIMRDKIIKFRAGIINNVENEEELRICSKDKTSVHPIANITLYHGSTMKDLCNSFICDQIADEKELKTEDDLLNTEPMKMNRIHQFILIESSFYCDLNNTETIEFINHIISSIAKNFGKKVESMPPMDIKSWNTPLIEPPVHLGFPYFYYHGSHCQHQFIYSSIRIARPGELNTLRCPKVIQNFEYTAKWCHFGDEECCEIAQFAVLENINGETPLVRLACFNCASQVQLRSEECMKDCSVFFVLENDKWVPTPSTKQYEAKIYRLRPPLTPEEFDIIKKNPQFELSLLNTDTPNTSPSKKTVSPQKNGTGTNTTPNSTDQLHLHRKRLYPSEQEDRHTAQAEPCQTKVAREGAAEGTHTGVHPKPGGGNSLVSDVGVNAPVVSKKSHILERYRELLAKQKADSQKCTRFRLNLEYGDIIVDVPSCSDETESCFE